MRAIPAIGLVGGILFLAGLFGLAADDQPVAQRPIDELVRDLGSPVFSTREQAVELLRKRGREAVPALEKAASDPNEERARRARSLLNGFSWQIFPDTPPAVLKQIIRFRDGKPEEQKAAVSELLTLGKAGRAAARAILQKNLPAETRDPLLAYLTTRLRHDVPLLLFDGKVEEAGELIAIHTSGTTPEGAADFAAFQVLRGTLPAAIADAEAARASARNIEAADLVLAHLYRATGDWEKARTAAEAIDRARAGGDHPQGRTTLVRMLMEEEGDWADLLDTTPPAEIAETNLPDALKLTFLRLAGRDKEYRTVLKKTRENATELSARQDIRDAAFTLLLSNRAADATELLLQKRQNLGLLSEILIARLRFKDALELIRPGKTTADTLDPQEKLDFDLRRARVLVLTGHREEAIQLFTQVAAGLKTQAGETHVGDDTHRAQRALLRAEVRVGLRDLASEHAAQFVPAESLYRAEQNEAETVFDILYGNEADTAAIVYWSLRRNSATEMPGRTMNRVRDLLKGTAPKGVVDEAVKALSTLAPPPKNLDSRSDNTPYPDPILPPASDPRTEVDRHLALAAILGAARRDGAAEQAYAKAVGMSAKMEIGRDPLAPEELSGSRSWVFGMSDNARPWREFGDFLFDRERYTNAAERFVEGWKQHPDQPLLLYLSGKALEKSGNHKEGSRRMELAHWVALGNERIRGRFLEDLTHRGEGKAAKRETDLLLRACWSRDHYFGNVMNQAARAAMINKDWTTAERCVQRSLLVLMQTPRVHFVDTAAYLNIPHEMLAFQARGLLAAGKVDVAMIRARAVLEVTPGHAGMVSGMVPELDRLGRKKEADELFGRVWGSYKQVLSDYPNSPWARNGLAVLGANCRRELDASLTYAKEAVASDPKLTTFRETLAEVHFRRGERDQAVELMSTLASEDPRSHFYRRQLVRYKSGDIASPTPETEDE